MATQQISFNDFEKRNLPLNECYRVRRLEDAGKWYEARKIYANYGCKDDVAAIDLILQAREKGDRFRALLKQKEEAREEFIKDNVKSDYELEREAYQEIYGGS